MRPKISIIACLLLMGFTAPALAGEFSVFGPKNFIRETGDPVRVSHNFSVKTPNTQFILRLYNGGLSDTTTDLVSSSLVYLNGTEILGPRDFNQTVKYIEIPVTLRSTNTIEAEVRGKPGGLFTLHIMGIDNRLPVISNLTPFDNAEIEEKRPLISASYTDEISDI